MVSIASGLSWTAFLPAGHAPGSGLIPAAGASDVVGLNGADEATGIGRSVTTLATAGFVVSRFASPAETVAATAFTREMDLIFRDPVAARSVTTLFCSAATSVPRRAELAGVSGRPVS